MNTYKTTLESIKEHYTHMVNLYDVFTEAEDEHITSSSNLFRFIRKGLEATDELIEDIEG